MACPGMGEASLQVELQGQATANYSTKVRKLLIHNKIGFMVISPNG